MDKSKLLNKEDILKLKEGDKIYLVNHYTTKEQIGIVENVETINSINELFLNINLLNDKCCVKGTIDGILNRFDVYKYREEPKQYSGIEILQMIKDGQLKEDDGLIGYMPNDEDKDEYNFKIKRDSNCRLDIREGTYGEGDVDSWDLLYMTFSIKEKEYLTFDDARKSGKRFKYKSWDRYCELDSVLSKLYDYLPSDINKLMDELAWEVEN